MDGLGLSFASEIFGSGGASSSSTSSPPWMAQDANLFRRTGANLFGSSSSLEMAWRTREGASSSTPAARKPARAASRTANNNQVHPTSFAAKDDVNAANDGMNTANDATAGAVTDAAAGASNAAGNAGDKAVGWTDTAQKKAGNAAMIGLGSVGMAAMAASALSKGPIFRDHEFWNNFQGSFDSTFSPTILRVVPPETDIPNHTTGGGLAGASMGSPSNGPHPGWHSRSEGAAGAAPDASFLGDGSDYGYSAETVPTPIRLAVAAETPFQPQDLPIVAVKMFQPRSGKTAGVVRVTSPDAHLFFVPTDTYL